MAEEVIEAGAETGTTVTDLKDLGGAAGVEAAATREPQIDEYGRAYATGRRKNACARVFLKPGTGKIVVNGKPMEEYFARKVQQMILQQPFELTERVNQFDVFATTKGGGLSGQAGAVRHGLSQALQKYEPALRPVLKAAGFLTRDPRMVERKKYGQHKARRGKQWAKR